jgi:hypothetical protein
MNDTQDAPEIALGKKMITQELHRTLKDRMEQLRKLYPDLSFNALWERLKIQESALFARLKRIEEGDWSAGNGSIKAASADYILIRSEDERQLQRIEAALQ